MEQVNHGFGDYPIAPVEGVEAIFVPHMILGAMACRYATRTGIELDDAFDAARATWHTDWPDDPAPRTVETALEAVDGDLEHWGED